MLDFDKTAFEKRCVYDQELMRTIIEGSVPNLYAQLRKMKAAYRQGDASLLEREAHSLKGTSGTLSAERLYESALRIEAFAKIGSLDNAVEEEIRDAGKNAERFVQEVLRLGLYTEPKQREP